jgi:hypothetical protein
MQQQPVVFIPDDEGAQGGELQLHGPVVPVEEDDPARERQSQGRQQTNDSDKE